MMQESGSVSEGWQYCKATIPFEAQYENELSIKVGDIILILNRDDQDRGWWQGVVNDEIGVFPCEFVVPIINSDDESRNREQKASSMMVTETDKSGESSSPVPFSKSKEVRQRKADVSGCKQNATNSNDQSLLEEKINTILFGIKKNFEDASKLINEVCAIRIHMNSMTSTYGEKVDGKASNDSQIHFDNSLPSTSKHQDSGQRKRSAESYNNQEIHHKQHKMAQETTTVNTKVRNI
ncbi:hypothetical protein JTB14_031097 [Gonioctena quinquepunctata]|nr:hypothetical protein JTB14_031097 [Gonioctena quinquepunctata]